MNNGQIGRRVGGPAGGGLGIYIHIPFCSVRCPYCDFNTYEGLDSQFEAYTAALIEEIRRAGAAFGRPQARTIFIGGGTPTVLPAELLQQVLHAARQAFRIDQDAEITSEANPGTVDQERFAALRAMGVNRLSMGVQSFDDGELKWLGRIHGASEAEMAFEAARAAGFENINLDFMFGLPGQAPQTWRATLERALRLGPEHLSLYSLTVEPGTPLANRVRLGTTPAPDEDEAAERYVDAMSILAEHGHVHYEISNWARNAAKAIDGRQGGEEAVLTQPTFACRHNLIYWRDEPYLGFGAGAHSYHGRQRWWNARPVPEYIQKVRAGQVPISGSETIDERLEQGEVMMLGLRLVREGVGENGFQARFGTSLAEAFGKEIAELERRGLLEQVGRHVRLTAEGRLLGNRVFAMFLP